MALPQKKILQAYRGDDWQKTLTFTNADGTPTVLPTTGWNAHVKKSARDAEPLFAFTIDATDAAVGILVLSVQGAVTGPLASATYLYDVEHTPSRKTYVRGEFKLEGDITNVG